MANRRYFDSLLTRLEGRDAYAINCYQARCAGIWDFGPHSLRERRCRRCG